MKNFSYPETRSSIEADFKASTLFKDLNYDGSALSALIDALAKTAHRLGYAAKMFLDESFVDTSHTYAAISSHAKSLGVELRGVKAAAISVEVEAVTAPTFGWQEILVPQGSRIQSTNSGQDTRVFTCLDPFVLKRVSPGLYRGKVVAYEGRVLTKVFQIPASTLNPTITLQDVWCDSSTLKVSCRPQGSPQDFEVSERASTPRDIRRSGLSFWVGSDSASRRTIRLSGLSQQAQEVKVEWLSCRGFSGNGAAEFSWIRTTPLSPSDISDPAVSTITILSGSPSSGGADLPGIEECREAVLTQSRSALRLTTARDIQDYIKATQGDWAVVEAWGGEEEKRRAYGKTMVCVVPKSSRLLGLGARESILKSLYLAGIPGDSVEFVDAFPYTVDLNITVRLSSRLSTQGERAQVSSRVRVALEDWFGASRSRPSISSQEILKEVSSVTPQGSEHGIEVGMSVVLGASSPKGRLDLGFPVTRVSSPSLKVSVSSDASSIEWEGSGLVYFYPAISEFTAPRRTFFTLGTLRIDVT